MPKIHYDPEVKILSIRLQDNKSVESDVKENVVLDYDKDGHIVNIEIMEVNLEDVIQASQREESTQKHSV